MKNLFAAVALLMTIGCRSAGTVTLVVSAADPSYKGVPLYLELRDESDRRVAMTSTKVATSAPLQLRLRRVLDGRRYQARLWLDLDGDGVPPSPAGRAEPAFLLPLAGTSDLTLWYPRASWEMSEGVRAGTVPPFCQQNACGPWHDGKVCQAGQQCLYYQPVSDWLCCSKSPYEN